MVQAGLDIKQHPISKITNAKKAGRVVQVLHTCLASVRPLVQFPAERGREREREIQLAMF
jgi:hypothetical protein